MRYLFLLLLFIPFRIIAQTFPAFVAPAGSTKVFETRGDLDKDGIDEVVMAFNTNKKTDRTGYARELYICKVVNGSLKLWQKNSTVLWKSEDCGFCTDAGIDLSIAVKNSTIIIKQTFWHSTRHTSKYSNIYRYQNNDWFVIGSTYKDSYNCGYQHTYDINFSTKQVNVNFDNEDCEEDAPEYTPSIRVFKYPFKSVPKMTGFIPGKTEVRIPGSKQFFYY